jgi:hypothetical protein
VTHATDKIALQPILPRGDFAISPRIAAVAVLFFGVIDKREIPITLLPAIQDITGRVGKSDRQPLPVPPQSRGAWPAPP